MTAFIPRATFPLPTSLPKTYFLGHHAAGLSKMKHMLSTIDLIIECRDYRIPLTSRNPVLEKELGLDAGKTRGGKERIIVYTKCDLGADTGDAEGRRRMKEMNRRLRSMGEEGVGRSASVHFSAAPSLRPYLVKRREREQGSKPPSQHDKEPRRASEAATPASSTAETVRVLLEQLRAYADANFSLTGHRVLVAGMPNIGKSTLLNALRRAGIPSDQRSNKKVAKTGADPGVTRSVGSMVKILESSKSAAASTSSAASGSGGASGLQTPATRGARATEAAKKREIQDATTEPVYVLDTPGIFPPYMHSGLSMLKLALCGCVKDGLLPPITVADFLLFHVNSRGLWGVYDRYCEPTNDVGVLLDAVARKTGRLIKGQGPDLEGAAVWVVKRWRQGLWGRFVLDEVEEGGERVEEGKEEVSWSQAMRKEKERRRGIARERRPA